MAGLDTRYVPLFTLQDVLVDKTTGVELSGGFVSFYSDNDRNVAKQVYELSKNGANYTYTAVGTQLTLGAAGTFVDASGQDFVPYLFPYDGNATTTTNTLDLYYIVVQNSTGTQQFTREGVPNLEDETPSTSSDIHNFIANGQFLLHNTNSPVPGSQTIAYGGTQGTMNVINVAPGGWTLERTQGSAATDAVTFTRLGASSGISAAPRYAININRTVNAADILKLGIRFMDVNKFLGKNITFLFNAVLNSGSSLAGVQVFETDYFGTSSGSQTGITATAYTQQSTSQTITNTNTQFAINFTANNNTNTVIGEDNNDFVQFAIVFPASTSFNVQLTDFMVVLGNAGGSTSSSGGTIFPVTTNGQFILDAMSELAQTTPYPVNSSTQNYYPADGINLYLPVVMTPSGFTYDYSVIGEIRPSIYSNTYATAANSKFPIFLCDGSSKVSATYTSLGVPQSRLGAMLISDSPLANTPKFGTGLDYATAYAYTAPTNALRVSVNTLGAANAAVDGAGAGATGFTFTNVNTGAGTINYKAYSNVANTILCVGTFALAANSAAAGTSGFVITELSSTTGLLAQQQHYAFTLQAVGAAALANPGGVGRYFDFSNAATRYYMWFRVTSGGTQETDPAPFAGTGIMINLQNTATATAQDVANIIREAINKYQITSILVGAVPAASTYFTFSNQGNSRVFNVWYQVSGVGTAPATPSGANIQVTLTNADTTATTVTKTLTAINAYQYAVPDLRGMFLRGLDSAGTWDLDVAQRWSTLSALSGAQLGTFEFEQLIGHVHFLTAFDTLNLAAGSQPAGASGSSNGTSAALTTTGGTETRPVNAAVNYFIRY